MVYYEYRFIVMIWRGFYMQSPVESVVAVVVAAAMTTSVLAGGAAIMRRLHIDPVPPLVAMDQYSYIYNDVIIGGLTNESAWH